MLMEYLDVLRCGGWLPDPADRVRAAVEHGDGCPAPSGGHCRCVPRIVLRIALPRAASGRHACDGARSAGSADAERRRAG